MAAEPDAFSDWTRRAFIRTGVAAAGAVALGACARGSAPSHLDANGVAADLDGLARQVRGRFLREGSPLYDDARRVWNLAYDRRPLAMARCDGVDDVRRCVTFARRHDIPVAIRGGGHSYAGFGVADGALQVDLGAFNTVSVDPERRVASVGGGTRIKELLAMILPLGLHTPMGGCGDVGVAGLALAGGDTSPRGMYGTACDNVIGAQLVTADGDVLELGPDRNPDLFWAIRGGGGNFGVVTRLDFQLHPLLTQRRLSFMVGWNDIAGALRTFGELVRETPDVVRAGVTVDKDTGAVISTGHYGDAESASAHQAKWISAFRTLKPVVDTAVPTPQGQMWATTGLAVDGAFLEGLTDDRLVDVLARAALAGRSVGAMLFGLSNGVASRVPMADTAYPLRGVGFSSLLSAEWHTAAERVRAEQWVKEWGAALRPWARRAYVNYLAPSAPERIREVYGVNYARLARIKAQYDPANLFRSNQNIVPAIS
ncbi:MAG: FAD-binding oxidoreductase [Gemmatimonadetes bacterium]|nr:FAD-binding oxidoreductase [Gemmatimonadota bacterium]